MKQVIFQVTHMLLYPGQNPWKACLVSLVHFRIVISVEKGNRYECSNQRNTKRKGIWQGRVSKNTIKKRDQVTASQTLMTAVENVEKEELYRRGARSSILVYKKGTKRAVQNIELGPEREHRMQNRGKKWKWKQHRRKEHINKTERRRTWHELHRSNIRAPITALELATPTRSTAAALKIKDQPKRLHYGISAITYSKETDSIIKPINSKFKTQENSTDEIPKEKREKVTRLIPWISEKGISGYWGRWADFLRQLSCYSKTSTNPFLV